MRRTPTISIFLNSYNHEKFLRESIDSTLGQTFTDYELIIKDDASTDSSWDIICSYSDSRITAFRNEVNRQRQFGHFLPDLRGQYVAMHNSDDVWEPTKLEKQVAYLEAHPEVGAVFTRVAFIDENSRPISGNISFHINFFNQPNRDRFGWLNYFFYYGNALCHPSVLIRKECYEKCGCYRRGLVQLPDFDMWVRLCLKYEIHVLQEKLVNYRLLLDSANASSPTLINLIRSNFEKLQIYQNYLALTDRDELVRVLPAITRYEVGEYYNHRYLIARAALDKEDDPVCWLFGLQVLFDLLNDPREAAALKQYYQFTPNTFSQLSGSRDVFHEEVHQQEYQLVHFIKRKIWKWIKPLRDIENLLKKIKKN